MPVTPGKNPDELFRFVQQIGIIPAIRTPDVSACLRAAEAIGAGGIPILEISLAVPGAEENLEAVRKAQSGNLLVGAGSVIDEKMVHRAQQSGAQFIVTTGFSADVIQTARDCQLVILAGALTPTEVQGASAAGADAVKLFPCYATGGPRYVKTLRAQYPGVHLIASGGVTLENCAEYFRAGACAVGIGAEIIDAESLAIGNDRVFTERARRFRTAVMEIQAQRKGGIG